MIRDQHPALNHTNVQTNVQTKLVLQESNWLSTH